MMLCECASEKKSERSERSAIALVDNDDRDSILIVSVVYEDQRPAKVSFITYKIGSCWWVAGVGDLKLTSGRVWGPRWDGLPYEGPAASEPPVGISC
jgi:hypothetical protein